MKQKIQSAICCLRYALRGGKALHATNQPTTRPAATEERKDIGRVTAGKISGIYWQTSRWATSRQHYNGCLRSTSQYHKAPEAKQPRQRQMNQLIHFNASSHTPASVANQGSRGLFQQDKGSRGLGPPCSRSQTWIRCSRRNRVPVTGCGACYWCRAAWLKVQQEELGRVLPVVHSPTDAPPAGSPAHPVFHHQTAPVLVCKRNVKQGNLPVTVKDIHCCIDNVSSIIKIYQQGHLHLSRGLAHSNRLKWDWSDTPPEVSGLHRNTHGQLSFPLLFVSCGELSLPIFLDRFNLFRICSRKYSAWQF